MLEALSLRAMWIQRHSTQEWASIMPLLHRFYNLPAQASNHQGVDLLMAKIKVPLEAINRILWSQGKKSIYYSAEAKRIYVRKKGVFVAIGWQIHSRWARESVDAIILDSELES